MKKIFKLKNLIFIFAILTFSGLGYFMYTTYEHLFTKAPTSNLRNAGLLTESVVAKIPSEVTETKKVEPCTKWVSTNPAPAGTICILDSFKGFETNSDVLVWSYNLKDWDKPVGHGDINTKTVLIAGSKEYQNYYPLYVKCPWGCSFSLIEVKTDN